MECKHGLSGTCLACLAEAILSPGDVNTIVNEIRMTLETIPGVVVKKPSHQTTIAVVHGKPYLISVMPIISEIIVDGNKPTKSRVNLN